MNFSNALDLRNLLKAPREVSLPMTYDNLLLHKTGLVYFRVFRNCKQKTSATSGQLHCSPATDAVPFPLVYVIVYFGQLAWRLLPDDLSWAIIPWLKGDILPHTPVRDLKNFANSRPSALNFKSFSQLLEHFFHTIGPTILETKYHFFCLPLALELACSNNWPTQKTLWYQVRHLSICMEFPIFYKSNISIKLA